MHIAWEYPPLVYGGLGRHVHALATAQAADGHDVVVVTQVADGAPADSVDAGVRVVREATAPAERFTIESLIGWVAELDTALGTATSRLAADWHPDVVHCHDWMTTRAGQAGAAAGRAPLVATIHATERGRHQGHLPGDLSLCVDAVERYLCHDADRVITCSRAMSEEVVGQFLVPSSRVSVIPNGIDVRHWRVADADRSAARQRWGPANGPLIVFTGRLEVEKGIFTLLDAMPRILPYAPAARLVVGGSGGQADAFDRECASRGLTGIVRRTGWLAEDELRGLVGAADVAVVPSLYEPFGLVALEAMALGAPVVCARTGGLADVVDPGVTGLLFEPGDAAALAAAVVAAIADPAASRARAEAAAGALRVRFDWATIAADTVAVYESAAAGVA